MRSIYHHLDDDNNNDDGSDDGDKIDSASIKLWAFSAMMEYKIAAIKDSKFKDHVDEEEDDKMEGTCINSWNDSAIAWYRKAGYNDTNEDDINDRIDIPMVSSSVMAEYNPDSADKNEEDGDMMERVLVKSWLRTALAVYDDNNNGDDDDDKMEHERIRIRTSLFAAMSTLGDDRKIWNSLPLTQVAPFKHEVIAEVTLPKLAVYYYCHHARNHDELSHFLAWLLSQLCRKAQDIPEHICNLFESDCRPHSDHLVEAIKFMAARFYSVLVSVDAVDESQNRDNLTKFLKRLAWDPEFGCFHVVVTSRREVDIERHLGAFTNLSMSNPLVDLDTAKYVEEQLQTDRSLRRFSVKLQAGIKESLLARANGMFRLVICQLQVLKRVPVEFAAWKMLEQLPETLDETYERILVGVPPGWVQIVRRAFCLLVCKSLVGVKELITFASASEYGNGDIPMTEDLDVEPSEEAFLEVMGCLINTAPGPTRLVRLAHYTIKEYLGSSRIVQSSASFFYQPASEAMSDSVKTMLRALAHDGRNDESWLRFKSYCEDHILDLVKIADTVIASDKQLTALVVKAMDPHMTTLDVKYNVATSGNWPGSLGNSVLDRPDVGTLVNLISENLYATTTAVLLQYTAEQATSICLFEVEVWNNITVVAWLAENHRDEYLLLVLERCGAQINNHRQSLLICTMANFCKSDDACQTVKTLINANVTVNPQGMRVTPLQLAVSQLRVDVIKILLDNGADPNAVGNPDGWTLTRLRHFEGGMTPLSKMRMMRSYTSVETWFSTSKSDVDKIEELLVNAGGRESCTWLVRDFQLT
ncbi:hypothetical protein B0J13DRAFT_627669 [Dactylonectria estremocensis]|uniref:Nephrocystin 3-like N-terminal domain-containing protein n=1 Tax=Dactylonectria estremocensis TaxID=1079267 RepID=A0A9P9IQX9_9HYPO|nr:hypothetical protein B0J13DRAFT_627669 [Dactylonectria estremocensis]